MNELILVMIKVMQPDQRCLERLRILQYYYSVTAAWLSLLHSWSASTYDLAAVNQTPKSSNNSRKKMFRRKMKPVNDELKENGFICLKLHKHQIILTLMQLIA